MAFDPEEFTRKGNEIITRIQLQYAEDLMKAGKPIPEELMKYYEEHKHLLKETKLK